MAGGHAPTALPQGSMNPNDTRGQDGDGIEHPGVVGKALILAQSEGVPVADGYRITTVVPYANKDPEVNTHHVPPQDLNEFFQTYPQTGEIVVDVRPVGDDD